MWFWLIIRIVNDPVFSPADRCRVICPVPFLTKQTEEKCLVWEIEKISYLIIILIIIDNYYFKNSSFISNNAFFLTIHKINLQKWIDCKGAFNILVELKKTIPGA